MVHRRLQLCDVPSHSYPQPQCRWAWLGRHAVCWESTRGVGGWHGDCVCDRQRWPSLV